MLKAKSSLKLPTFVRLYSIRNLITLMFHSLHSMRLSLLLIGVYACTTSLLQAGESNQKITSNHKKNSSQEQSAPPTKSLAPILSTQQKKRLIYVLGLFLVLSAAAYYTLSPKKDAQESPAQIRSQGPLTHEEIKSDRKDAQESPAQTGNQPSHTNTHQIDPLTHEEIKSDRKDAQEPPAQTGNQPSHTNTDQIGPLPKVEIKPDSPLLDPKNRIFRTKLDYTSATFYEDIGYNPDEVYLVNAANASVNPGKGGTNKYLTDLIGRMVEQKGIGQRGTWGELKDREGKEWPKGKKLKVGEYVISTHPTGVKIVHLLGPKLKAGEADKLDDLSIGITTFLNDIRRMPDAARCKIIVLPGISTGIFADNEEQRREAYAALLEGINKAYKDGGPIGSLLAINWWDPYNKDIAWPKELQQPTTLPIFTAKSTGVRSSLFGWFASAL